MAAPVIVRANFFAAQVHRHFVGERHARQARLFEQRHVGAGIAMRDHLGIHREHLRVAARMVVVLVGVQHVLDGFVGHRPQLFQDLVVIAVEHVVDENHALIGHLHRDVSRAHALGHADDIQIVLQLLNADGAAPAGSACR